MSILDEATGQFGGTSVAEIAGAVGLTREQVESAIAALGRSLPEPGDTAQIAATRTGLPVERVRQVLDRLGGKDALARIAGSLSEGGGIDSVLSGLFSRG